jgi:hypothetical protein
MKISRQWQRDEYTLEIHEADFELGVVTCMGLFGFGLDVTDGPMQSYGLR